MADDRAAADVQRFLRDARDVELALGLHDGIPGLARKAV